MLYRDIWYKFGAGCLLLIAVIVGCASEPAQEHQTRTEMAQSILEANKSQESSSTIETLESDEPPAPEVVDETPEVVIEEDIDNTDQFVNGKKLSIPKITGSVPPRDDAFHDTDNNAIVVLQSPTEAMGDFPRDRRREVDWVKALDQGFIEPRANLKGGDKMVTMDLDIIMKNTQFMPWVKFPHLQHTRWLACENCHPKIFIPQEHANPISMNKVLRGEYCGVCHDKVSFSLFVCERCHSVPHEGSGPAWWKTEK